MMTTKTILTLINQISVTEAIDLNVVMETFEYRIIDQALLKSKGNRAYAAMILGINRTTLIEKLRRRDKLQEKGLFCGSK